jgi:hypothetical protein
VAAIDPRIVGIWQLKSTAGRDDAGKVLDPPYGPLAMGLVTFQADGRMMAVLCDGRATLAGEPRQFMSYAGNYSFDGATLSTRVDAYWTAQRRMDTLWHDERARWKSTVGNTARMAWFSSDRSISEHAADIRRTPIPP